MLKLKNLSCGYAQKTVLTNINLDIKKGQIIGIVGPNGCGKSTLVKTIASLLTPLSGEIFFKDKNIAELKPKDLAKEITLLRQMSQMPPFTALDFVLTGRIPYRSEFSLQETKSDYLQALRCMRITGTHSFKDSIVSRLSGGEQQLCKIAKALAQDPDLLVMDEPNTGLDITHQLQIMNLMRKLNKKFSLTLIMVLHDLNLAASYCDRIAMIKDGGIYDFDIPEKVITQQNIEDVYNTTVTVTNHPNNNTPYIVVP